MAICCKVCEYQFRGRNTIFLLAMFALILWVLYFVFQGDFVSAIANIVSFTSVFVFSKREKCKWARSVWWLILFVVIQCLLSALAFKSWKDLFAFAAGVLGVFAYYSLDLKKYRFLSFFYAVAWLGNSLFKMYPLALICDVLSTTSVSISIYRYDIKKKKITENHSQTQKED